MQSILNKALCQLGIFMICTQAMIHFRPNDSYEKYLKLLVSVMLLVQVVEPVSRIFTLGMEGGLTERVAYFQESMEESLEQALERANVELTLEELSRQEVERRVQQLAEEPEGEKPLEQEVTPIIPITIEP